MRPLPPRCSVKDYLQGQHQQAALRRLPKFEQQTHDDFAKIKHHIDVLYWLSYLVLTACCIVGLLLLLILIR